MKTEACNYKSLTESRKVSINMHHHYNLERRLKPTHRRRRRDETVELLRVGVGGVYINSQLTHDDCRRIRRCERSRRPWPSLQSQL